MFFYESCQDKEYEGIVNNSGKKKLYNRGLCRQSHMQVLLNTYYSSPVSVTLNYTLLSAEVEM
jgi:hypothetical protein